MTIKDTFETAGVRTTAGAPALASHVPARDAVAVQRLVDAGAIVFGKTNVPLFAADVQTLQRDLRHDEQPWDAARTPGGSSGGAAAALAGGLHAARARQRHRRLDPQPGALLRRLRPQAELRPGPACAATSPDRRARWRTPTSASPDRWRATPAISTLALDVLAGPDAARAVGLAARAAAAAPTRRCATTASRPGSTIPAARSTPRCGEVFESVAERLRRAGVDVDDRARPVADLSRGRSATTSCSCADHRAPGSPRAVRRLRARRRERGPRRPHAATTLSRAHAPCATANGCGSTNGARAIARNWASSFALRRPAVPGHADAAICPRPRRADGRAPHRRQRRAARLLGPVRLGRGDRHGAICPRPSRPAGRTAERAAGRRADRRPLPRGPHADRLRPPARRRRRRIRAAAGF